MNEEILSIIPTELPFSLDDKIFVDTDDEGNVLGLPYSYNDFLKNIEDISGVSEDLMGKYE